MTEANLERVMIRRLVFPPKDLPRPLSFPRYKNITISPPPPPTQPLFKRCLLNTEEAKH